MGQKIFLAGDVNWLFVIIKSYAKVNFREIIITIIIIIIIIIIIGRRRRWVFRGH